MGELKYLTPEELQQAKATMLKYNRDRVFSPLPAHRRNGARGPVQTVWREDVRQRD